MRAGGKPGPTRMQTSPPTYLKHQGSAGPRLSPTYILFILWLASLVNHSILLIQTIRKLHLPLVTLCNLTCQLSRPPPGNDNHPICAYFIYVFCTNLFVLSVPRLRSPRGRRSPSRSMSRTCLSQRQPLKSRQPPLHLRPLPQPPRQRSKHQLTRRPPAQPHQLTTRTW